MTEFSKEQKESIKNHTEFQLKDVAAVRSFFIRNEPKKEPYYKTTLTHNIEKDAYQE